MTDKRDLVLGVAFGLALASGVFLTHLGVQRLVSLAPSGAKVISADDVEGVSYNTANYSQPNGHYLSTEPHLTSNSLYTWGKVGSPPQTFITAMEQEIGKYDPKFLDEIGLNRVYIVENILDKHGRKALGFSETISGNIYLNAVDSQPIGADARSTIHHEIGHLLFVSGLGVEGLNSHRWQDMNDSGHVYGADSHGSDLFPSEGFVTGYAMSSVAEDMAEVFAFAMSDGYHELLFEEIESDETLREKVDFVSGVAAGMGFSEPWQPLYGYQAGAGE